MKEGGTRSTVCYNKLFTLKTIITVNWTVLFYTITLCITVVTLWALCQAGCPGDTANTLHPEQLTVAALVKTIWKKKIPIQPAKSVCGREGGLGIVLRPAHAHVLEHLHGLFALVKAEMSVSICISSCKDTFAVTLCSWENNPAQQDPLSHACEVKLHLCHVTGDVSKTAASLVWLCRSACFQSTTLASVKENQQTWSTRMSTAQSRWKLSHEYQLQITGLKSSDQDDTTATITCNKTPSETLRHTAHNGCPNIPIRNPWKSWPMQTEQNTFAESGCKSLQNDGIYEDPTSSDSSGAQTCKYWGNPGWFNILNGCRISIYKMIRIE